MMTKLQDKKYWRLWSAVHKADPALDRHELTERALGIPKSHKEFTNADFDKWIGAAEAIIRPDNINPQIRQAKMPETRQLHAVRLMQAALEVTNAYVAGIIRRMNARGALGNRELNIDDLNADQIEKVIIALAKECRRRWPLKGDLILAIMTWIDAMEIDQVAAVEVIQSTLKIEGQIHLSTFDYDTLIKVMGAIRPLARVEHAETTAA